MQFERKSAGDQYPAATTTVGAFLIRLFRRLDECGVNYCVLRGYDGLPNSIGYDVDLIVGRNSTATYVKILRHTIQDCNWSLVRAAHRFSFRSHYIVHQEDGRFVLLKIDTHTRIHWKEVISASETVIFETRKRYNGFWIVSSGCEAAVSLFKEYLHFGIIRDKHKRRIPQLVQEDPQNFLASTEPLFGLKVSSFALKCAQREDWNTLERNAARIRLTLINKALIRRPFGQLLDWLRFLWGHFSDKILYPSGFFVCLIGPDGSGKTTISRGLERNMTEVFSKVLYFHGHLGILPPLKHYYNFFARMFGGCEKRVSLDDATPNLDALPFSRMRALVYIIYYSLDYFLGHVTIRRAKGHGGLVLFDRYFYDYLIQHPYAKVPRWLLRAFLRVLPKPDIVIWLENEPESIFRRKQELTLAQITKQHEICRDIVARHSNAFSVQTDDAPEVTLNRVRQIIFDSMAIKVKKQGV